MSNRASRACKIDIDYRRFHTEGVKIPKNRKSDNGDFLKMSGDTLEERKMQELQIFNDIQEVYDTNIIGDTESVDELTEVLDEISILGKQYRHIHVELKYLLGDQYAAEYPLFDARLDALRKYITSVKDKIKELRSTEMGSEKKILVSSLKTEEEIVRQRLDEFLAFEMDENSKLAEVVEGGSQLKQFLETYYGLLSKAKVGLGVDFQNEFGNTFDDVIAKIKEKMSEVKKLVDKIESNIEDTAAKEKTKQENEMQLQYISEQKFQANALLTEIKNRCETLLKKMYQVVTRFVRLPNF